MLSTKNYERSKLYGLEGKQWCDYIKEKLNIKKVMTGIDDIKGNDIQIDNNNKIDNKFNDYFIDIGATIIKDLKGLLICHLIPLTPQ